MLHCIMKRLGSTRVRLVMCFSLLLGVVAYATRENDPLKRTYQETFDVVFGVENKNAIFPGPDERTGGLFSAKDSDEVIRTVPLRNHPAYDQALARVRSLKQMIESEAVKRGDLADEHRKFENLLEVIVKYLDFQRIFQLNYLANLHENTGVPGAFRVDELNLKLSSRLGLKLVLRKDLMAKYHVRHTTEADRVELFLPPYERVQLEATALARVKTKLEYQKFIHFSYLRDSLVNRWALKRISPSGIEEGVSIPPQGYDSFAGERADRSGNFAFSRDLGVEDRYQARIKDVLPQLKEELKDMPLGSEEEYRELIQAYYGCFSQLATFPLNPDSLIANLFDIEERTLEGSSEQVILEGSFPEDDLAPAAIARRTSHNAFLVRRSGVLKALLYQVKMDLVVWEGVVNLDNEGMISEQAFLDSEKLLKIPKADLARAEKVVDGFLARAEQPWRTKMASRIEAFYRSGKLKPETLSAKERNEEFFKQTIKIAGEAMFHLGQTARYDLLKKKFDLLPSNVAESLDHQRVPLEVECSAQGTGLGAPVLASSCVAKVKSDLYLSGLDATADAGMSWTIPWTPEQIRSLLSAKMRFLEEHDPKKWEQVKNVVQDPVLDYFFKELSTRQQEVNSQRKLEIQVKKLELSEKLGKYLEQNPGTVMEETSLYREMAKLQEKIDSVGLNPRESTLNEEMYEEAARKALSRRFRELDTPPPPARTKINPEEKQSVEFQRKRTILAPDKSQVVTPSGNSYELARKSEYHHRARTKLEIARVFSLLGFGVDFLSEYFHTPELFKNQVKLAADFRFESWYPKPDQITAQALGGILGTAPREKRGSALSEIARSAHSQKLLSEVLIEGIYVRAPFLRIREGDDLKAPTGLERLFKAYSTVTGWNRSLARATFDSLVNTALRNDAGKVEDALQARPELPEEDPRFKRIFRAQATQRSFFHATLWGSRQERVARWEEDLKLETRTTEEVWNDRFHFISSVLMGALLVFMLFQILPVLVAAFGVSMSAASAAFSGFSGGMILGVLTGGNYLVQLFFLSTIVVQGNVAFFVLPAQMKYEREIANSTVGLTTGSERILLPSERVAQEQLSQMDEQIQTAKWMTGFGAALQVAFLPRQVSGFLRWSGASGRAALSRLGATSPEVARAIQPISLNSLVKEHGAAKGGRMYLERYRAALVANKAISSVNGGAVIGDVEHMLTNSLHARLPDSASLTPLLQARIVSIGDEVLRLRERAMRYFKIVGGGKPETMEEAVRIFIGKELGHIKFRLQDPMVRIGIEESFYRAVLQGQIPEIAAGSEKHLITVFLHLREMESLMSEAVFLQSQVQRIQALEAAAGASVDTGAIFADFSRLQNFRTLEHLLEWGARRSELQASGLGRVLEDARKATRDYKILIDDISKLTPREQHIYKAMRGNVHVVVTQDFTLQLGAFDPAGVEKTEFLLLPGSEVLSP